MTYKKYGTLEVICGPMYSGKTTETLKRILWAKNGENKRVLIYKPSFDNRYAETEIVSHDGLRAVANSVNRITAIDPTYDLIVFDEVQFFTKPYFEDDIIEIVKSYLNEGINVFASGLDMDWQGNPFFVTGQLLAMADKVKKLKANCTISGRPAGKTFKKTGSGDSVELGAQDLYEARSNDYWVN